MLKEIKITKLFGRFNYELSFQDDGIMIITGPNGYGKSTILKMLNNLFNDNIKAVLAYDFQLFEVKSLERRLTIKKNSKTIKINNHMFKYSQDEWERHRSYRRNRLFWSEDSYLDILSDNDAIKIEIAKQNRPRDPLYDAILDEIEYNVKTQSKIKKEKGELIAAFAEIEDIKKEIGTVQFIQEQRLIEQREITRNDKSQSREKREQVISVINENSQKLKNKLDGVMQEHSVVSSELDSTYIARLFSAKEKKHYNEEEMRSGLRELQEKQEKLRKYGLAEINNVSYISTLETKKMDRFAIELSIYLKDANEKYNVFSSTINKLELYESIVNRKLTFKKMYLSRSSGIVVKSEEGKILPLDSLSSGEQEIIVLFYKLIFEADVNLLLIDEPEISLHIAWQKEILENFKSIINLNKDMQLIIATHSPQIISKNWNLQVDLGGLYNG